MDPRPTALQADWLTACRRATRAVERLLADRPATVDRAEVTGRGSGGDRTLIIDSRAEEAVFAELDRLRDEGHRFTAISEERGEVDYGGGDVRVIIDPIDGSLNAKRGVPSHSVSIAVAEGPTMDDVVFAYVHDLGAGEEWTARRGEGALLGERPVDPEGQERRGSDGRLEILGIESADPRWVAQSIDGLVERTRRLRALGSIAISLCQVAGARFDGMLSLRKCRGVDAAAGQLIVREAGGFVAFPGCDDPLGAPLDTVARSPVVAARSEASLDDLVALARAEP